MNNTTRTRATVQLHLAFAAQLMLVIATGCSTGSANLERRIEALESQLNAAQRTVQSVVRANKFELVDNEGTVRGSLDIEDGTTRFLLLNAAGEIGRSPAGVAIFVGRTGSEVNIADSVDKPMIRIQIEKGDQPSILVQDYRTGKSVVLKPK